MVVSMKWSERLREALEELSGVSTRSERATLFTLLVVSFVGVGCIDLC